MYDYTEITLSSPEIMKYLFIKDLMAKTVLLLHPREKCNYMRKILPLCTGWKSQSLWRANNYSNSLLYIDFRLS